MDILKMIQIQRHAMFLGDSNLKRHHYILMEKFDKYCIKSDDDADDSDLEKLEEEEEFDENGVVSTAFIDEYIHEDLLYFCKKNEAKIVE